MPEKLLYLHGADSNVGSEDLIKDKYAKDRVEFIYKLAGGKGNVISFNAPFSTDPDDLNKRSWFQNPVGKHKKHNPIPQIQESAKHIVEKVQESGVKPQDLTLCGASQGGFMALFLTLHNIIVPKKTIVIVPFYQLELIKMLGGPKNLNKGKVPILYADVEKDEEIPKEFNTGARLQTLNINLTHIHCTESEHGKWTEDFKNRIIDWNRQHCA
ncbi:MAG: alpha/beta hydrolase [Alphaproteobacteria bacterium]|nr:alpha/beta hydrolase [Alphaproteobacteria bacterium]